MPLLDTSVVTAPHNISQSQTSADTVTLKLTDAPAMVPITVAQSKKRPLIAGTTSSSLGTTNVGNAVYTVTLDESKIEPMCDNDSYFGFEFATANNRNLNDTCLRLIATTFHKLEPDNPPPVAEATSTTKKQTTWDL